MSSIVAPSAVTVVQYANPGRSAKKSGGSGGKKVKKSASLPPAAVEHLKAWMMSPEHIAHPYPTEQEKAQIMKDTGIEMKQLTNWFVNNRKRYWKPRVEARIQQQAQAAAVAAQAHAAAVAAVTVAQQVQVQQQQQQQPSGSSPASPSAAATMVSPQSAFKPSSLVTSPNGSLMAMDLGVTNEAPISSNNQSCLVHATLPSPSSAGPSSAMASLAAQLLVAQQEHQSLASLLSHHVFSLTTAAPVSETSSTTHSVSAPASVSGSSSIGGDLSSDFEDEQPQSPSQPSSRRPSQPMVLDAIVTMASSARSHTAALSSQEQTMTNNARTVSYSSLEQFSGEQTAQQQVNRLTKMTSSKPHKKRKHFFDIESSVEDAVDVAKDAAAAAKPFVAPRKRFQRMNLDMWIESCQQASHANDEALPSLDEASRLFGYSSSCSDHS